MKVIRCSFIIIAIIMSDHVFSQTTGSKGAIVTLPIVTLMDIEPAGNITLSFVPPTEAGRPIVSPTANTSKWINYTSAIAAGGLSRRITASVNQTIAGVDIKLQAGAATGAGGGTMGTSAGLVTLTTSPITIISGIGGAYTGNGANNGHLLTLSLVINTYSNLITQSNTPVVITYTITE